MMERDRREFLKWATATAGVSVFLPEMLFARRGNGGLPASQQKAIARLWHDERLRASLAKAFGDQFGDDMLQTLGSWSAANRRAVLDEIVKLYDVDLSHTEDAVLLYSAKDLVGMAPGVFPSSKMEERYKTLKNEGLASKEKAFLVLAKESVDSVDTMKRYLAGFGSAKIKESITYLIDGSIASYWAINQKLIDMGVVEGCCKAGTKYCKTSKEYPLAYGTDHIAKDTTLTQDQRHALAHMWSEEKMAHDAFEAVYGVYPQLRLFYNIGHWSEVQHMTAVEELVALYNIDVNDYSNTDAHYKPSELRQMGAGDYAISDFEDRYKNTLIPYALKGDMYALKLGCMVEVQDIRDLTQFMKISQDNSYITHTFKYLIAGSQSHYWAYHYALIAKGEKEGCACLGDDYRKTPDEYPSGSGDHELAMLWNRHDGRFDRPKETTSRLVIV